jgi:hypothetical protein
MDLAASELSFCLEGSMQHAVALGVMVGGLFAGILALIEIGRRVEIWRRKRYAKETESAYGVVDGAVFALLGLIIAFTFSGAGARFDVRRQLMGQEANAIGTAYLRLDLLPSTTQPELREDFRNYADARIAMYRSLTADPAIASAEQQRSLSLQRKIWAEAIDACRQAESVATTSLVIQSLNEMIDMSTTQTVALMTHPSAVIYWTLLLLVLAGALLAGLRMGESKKPEWIHIMVFSAIMAAAVYVIFDLEYPRLGLIRVDAADQVLIDVRKSME